MSTAHRPGVGPAFSHGRDPIPMTLSGPSHAPAPALGGPELAETVPVAGPTISPRLFKSLAEVKGQAQFLLYLADQIEDSLDQLAHDADDCQGAFLCKVLGMYSSQIERKHQGLGDRIAETCQEIYVTVREFDAMA